MPVGAALRVYCVSLVSFFLLYYCLNRGLGGLRDFADSVFIICIIVSPTVGESTDNTLTE